MLLFRFIPKKARTTAKKKTKSAKKNAKGKKPMTKPGANFIASDSFVGSKPGYVFKVGSNGTGYYLDEPAQAKNSKKRKISATTYKSKKSNDAKKKDGDLDGDDVVVGNEDFVSLTGAKDNTTSTVVYLGHIPHGFYEEQVCTNSGI